MGAPEIGGNILVASRVRTHGTSFNLYTLKLLQLVSKQLLGDYNHSTKIVTKYNRLKKGAGVVINAHPLMPKLVSIPRLAS